MMTIVILTFTSNALDSALWFGYKIKRLIFLRSNTISEGDVDLNTRG